MSNSKNIDIARKKRDEILAELDLLSKNAVFEANINNNIDKSVNSEYLAQLVYNNVTFFVNTVQNSSSKSEIDNIKKSILNTIKIYMK